jgi:hypothetical protein
MCVLGNEYTFIAGCGRILQIWVKGIRKKSLKSPPRQRLDKPAQIPKKNPPKKGQKTFSTKVESETQLCYRMVCFTVLGHCLPRHTKLAGQSYTSQPHYFVVIGSVVNRWAIGPLVGKSVGEVNYIP